MNKFLLLLIRWECTNVQSTVETEDTSWIVDIDRGLKLERYLDLAPSSVSMSSEWNFSRFSNSSSISVISLSFTSISFSTIDMLFSISIKLILTSCNAFSSSAISSSILWFSVSWSWMTKSSDLIVESSETTSSVVLLLVLLCYKFPDNRKI